MFAYTAIDDPLTEICVKLKHKNRINRDFLERNGQIFELDPKINSNSMRMTDVARRYYG